VPDRKLLFFVQTLNKEDDLKEDRPRQRQGMRKEEFDLWQDHSLRYLEMAFRTDRQETIERPDGYGKRTGECGDTVELFLIFRGDRIASVSFDTDGCMSTNACANTVAELAEGKSLEKAWEISTENVIKYLETLPPENIHCAELAVGAFYLALANYKDLKRNPYKIYGSFHRQK
jgi:nitrogen fixation protein NifU and related proteins